MEKQSYSGKSPQTTVFEEATTANGWWTSSWYYRKPYSDPILLWCLLTLWHLLRSVSEAVGKRSRTLRLWDLKLFLRAARHARIQDSVRLTTVPTEKNSPISSAGDSSHTQNTPTQPSPIMSSADMKKAVNALRKANLNIQGSE